MCALMAALLAVGTPAAFADRCEEEYPAQPQRTGLSASLPDCRAYELVTPPFESGQFPFPGTTNGSSVTYSTLGAPGSTEADPSASGADYVATRGSSGWTSVPVDPPSSRFKYESAINTSLEAISQSFESMLFLESPAASSRVQSEFNNVWIVRGPDGQFTEVGPVFSPATFAELQPLGFAAGALTDVANEYETKDLSTILFSIEEDSEQGQTNWHWPGDNTDKHEPSLYEYAGSGNSEPVLVGVKNEGPLHGSLHINEGAEPISQCGTGLGSGQGPLFGDEHSVRDKQNAVSSDGAVVFFTPYGPGMHLGICTGATPPAAELFARVHASHTVAISEPTAADCTECNTGAPQDAVFQGASEDGSKVFFLTAQELLPGNPGENLYMYDFNGPVGHKITAVSHLASNAAAEVLGELSLAEDGSRLYYVANGVLTSEANGVGAHAQPGQPNLYVYDTETRRPAFVATLSSGDAKDWSEETAERKVDLTPDGRFLLFVSSANVTPDASGVGQQFYRYDAQTGKLVRVSKGENEYNNDGNNANAAIEQIPGRIPNNVAPTVPLTRSMSDDGAYVFFQTETALTPGALNDVCVREIEGQCFGRAQNVYEYHEGHVYLISDGQDLHTVFGGSTVVLIGTDASGGDVVFTTADQLAPQDTNAQKDIYDARVGGGFPGPVTAAACQEAGCQGAVPSAPPESVPGSSSFVGPGNLTPPSVKPTPKPLTDAQKLAKALKACKSRKVRKKRAACERTSRKAYGAAHKAKRSATHGRASR